MSRRGHRPTDWRNDSRFGTTAEQNRIVVPCRWNRDHQVLTGSQVHLATKNSSASSGGEVARQEDTVLGGTQWLTLCGIGIQSLYEGLVVVELCHTPVDSTTCHRETTTRTQTSARRLSERTISACPSAASWLPQPKVLHPCMSHILSVDDALHVGCIFKTCACRLDRH